MKLIESASYARVVRGKHSIAINGPVKLYECLVCGRRLWTTDYHVCVCSYQRCPKCRHILSNDHGYQCAHCERKKKKK